MTKERYDIIKDIGVYMSLGHDAMLTQISEKWNQNVWTPSTCVYVQRVPTMKWFNVWRSSFGRIINE